MTIVRAEGADDEETQHRAFAEADVEHAAAFVAATEDDMTNLWLVERARRANRTPSWPRCRTGRPTRPSSTRSASTSG